ncbi:hypothetical protein HOY82DRAFT_563731, partial [Tuber indicum]
MYDMYVYNYSLEVYKKIPHVQVFFLCTVFLFTFFSSGQALQCIGVSSLDYFLFYFFTFYLSQLLTIFPEGNRDDL